MELITDFTEINFIPGSYFMWSPNNQAIVYDTKRLKTNSGRLALLHEIGHACHNHRIYKYDMELIRIEMEAWDFVREHAHRYGIKVDEDHIARCIESYDYWLTKRATCPDCRNFCLQKGRDEYGCFACGAVWQVNWRKDRRVKRTVVSRYEDPRLGLQQFAS